MVVVVVVWVGSVEYAEDGGRAGGDTMVGGFAEESFVVSGVCGGEGRWMGDDW